MNLKMPDMFFIFPIGGAGYNLLEILWRGYTHWSMALAGGLCFCCIYAICSSQGTHFLTKCALCAFTITGIEFVFGCIVNLLFHMEVWDYSHLPLHLLGQVCLPYTALWFLLTMPLIPLCKRLNVLIRKLEAAS